MLKTMLLINKIGMNRKKKKNNYEKINNDNDKINNDNEMKFLYFKSFM